MIKTALLAAGGFLAAVLPVAAGTSDAPQVHASGRNVFRLGRGYGEIDLPVAPKPYDYLVNHLDFDLGIRSFYFRGRMQVEEPGLGLNADLFNGDTFREYLSRRTLGFRQGMTRLSVGHTAAVFSRGLTLNLREDVSIDAAALLDGVMLELTPAWATLTALAGRGVEVKSIRSRVEEVPGASDVYLRFDNDQYRDNIMGINLQLFPSSLPRMAGISWPELLAGSALGGGLVAYRANAGALETDYIPAGTAVDSAGTVYAHDTTIYYRDRTDLYLPSAFISLATPWGDLYMEHARMYAADNRYYTDTLVTLDRGEKIETAENAATYASLGAQAGDVSLLVEFKNYFYAREYTPGLFGNVDLYLEPPQATLRHTWQLLTKHVPANLMNDIIGYSASGSWTGYEPAVLTVAYNRGGVHKTTGPGTWSLFDFSARDDYWEAYLEWEQQVNAWLDGKVGFDYGRLYPDAPDERFATAGLHVNMGPFRERHAFSLDVEYQTVQKDFRAEADSAAVIRMAAPWYSYEDSLFGVDAFSVYRAGVPEKEKSVYTQRGANMLATLSYSFAPGLILTGTFEKETHLFDGMPTLVREITARDNTYLSCGMRLVLLQRHVLRMEYGSFSGGQKCGLGACVYIPAFKGFKCTLTSTF